MLDYLEPATRLVREAGLMAKDMIHGVTVFGDKGRGDFVTEADLKVEAHILSQLKALFPEHGFFSEEKGGERTDAEYVWMLDPIDGTKHYVRGNPLYAVSLGLRCAGEPLVGIVYLPEMDQLFCAEAGHGATLNGRVLQCSVEGQLASAMLCVEIPSRHASSEEKAWAHAQIGMLMHHAQRIRIVGISSIGLCPTASGSFDAYVNLGSAWQLHDVAAAEVVMQEAGGEYHQKGQRLIAGPQVLCSQIMDLIGWHGL